ncbi:MAG: hypothetical protein ACF8XB_14240, partial [Planctomycetota bacterium JB042]
MSPRSTGLLALLLVSACVHMPWTDDAQEVAKGSITISTPLFVPLLGATEEGKRLDFGPYRSEEKLIEAVHRSQLGKTLLSSKSFAGALSVALPTVEKIVTASDHLHQGDRSNWKQHVSEAKSVTKSGAPPEAPPSQLEEVLSGVLDKLIDRSAEVGQALPPDQVASLVEAYKSTMI